MSQPTIDCLGAMIGMMSAQVILDCSRDPVQRAEAQRTLESAQRILAACNDTSTPTTASTG